MMLEKGQITYNEIVSQFAAWEKSIKHTVDLADHAKLFWKRIKPSAIILTGCGTSHYLAQAGAFVFSDLLRIKTFAIPASELFLFPHIYVEKNGLLIVLSRSGTTTEAVRAAEVFREREGCVLAITCRNQSPLVDVADLSLIAVDAEDQSVIQTRSFTTMYVMLMTLAAILSDSGHYLDQLFRLAERAEQAFIGAKPLAEQLGSCNDLQTFIFLGSGHNYGLACAAMLNFKETALVHSEAYHFLEFRHGPFSIANRATLITGFLSGSAKDYEVRVLEEAVAIGVRTLVLGESNTTGRHFNVSICGLDDYVRSIGYFPVLHLISFYRALAKGLDPDSPPNLKRVITL